MNGFINANGAKAIIERELHAALNAGPDLNATELSNVINALGAKLYAAAWQDISAVAIDVVTRDAMETGPLDASHWHTIKNIKEVRELTGSGLKEAKDAVMQAMPVVLRNIAATALDNLSNENDKHGYALQEHVSAVRHLGALCDIEAAANAGHTPF